MNEIKINESSEFGTVKISNEVLALIVGTATREVEGVYSPVQNGQTGITDFVGKINLGKGVQVEVIDDVVNVNIDVAVKFGVKIPKVTKAIQEKVVSAVETMTGLEVGDVNIRVFNIEQ